MPLYVVLLGLLWVFLHVLCSGRVKCVVGLQPQGPKHCICWPDLDKLFAVPGEAEVTWAVLVTRGQDGKLRRQVQPLREQGLAKDFFGAQVTAEVEAARRKDTGHRVCLGIFSSLPPCCLMSVCFGFLGKAPRNLW